MRTFIILSFLLVTIYFCDGKRQHKHGKATKRLEKLENEEFLPVHTGKKRDRHGKHLDKDAKSLTISREELRKMPHLHFSKGVCTTPCPTKEVCVKDNMSGKSLCVKKRFLKESRRLFKMYKKKKFEKFHKGKKSWKKHGRKHMKKLRNKKGRKDEIFPEFHLKMSRKHGNPHNIDIEVLRMKKHGKKQLRNEKMKHGIELMDNIQDVNDLLYQGGVIKKHSHHASCKPDQLEETRKRLGGWFTVLHEEKKEQHQERRHPHHGHQKHKHGKHHHHHPCKCSRSVHWEFHRLDKNDDYFLTDEEMSAVEHNRNEKCIKPLLHSCDRNQDSRLSRREWCCCFSGIGPCMEKLTSIKESDMQSVKSIPNCTPDGFYDKVQCDISGDCWCSDLDGNEFPDTRKDTRKHGLPHCDKIDVLGRHKLM